MTGLAKGLIISAAVVVVIIALGIGVGIYWISAHGGEYVEKSKQSMTDGANFGKGTDNQGCVTETISRYKQDPGFSSAISTQLFVQGCLQASRETPGFCEAVPKRTEVMESVKWQMRQCAQYNLRDSYCGQIFGQVQTFCEMRQGRQGDGGTGRKGDAGTSGESSVLRNRIRLARDLRVSPSRPPSRRSVLQLGIDFTADEHGHSS